MRIALLAFLLIGPVFAQDPPGLPQPSVQIREHSTELIVDTSYKVPVSLAQAWEVLVDFDGMSSFLPGLNDSRVTAQNGARLEVEQHGCTRFGIFSLDFTSRREIVLQPMHSIRSRSLGGSVRIDGETTLSPDKDGTRVSYHAVVVPDFPGGVEFGTSMMEDQVREQIRAYIGEMTRRASLAQAGKSRPRKGA